MKRNFWFKHEWLIVGLGGIFALRSLSGIWKLWRTRVIVGSAQERLERTRIENRKLTEKLTEVQSGAFIEREAREKLGLGKPGETILILPPQDANSKPQIQNLSHMPNWQKWANLWLRLDLNQ